MATIRIISKIVLVALIPAAGFAIMRWLAYVLPLSEESNDGIRLLFVLIIIALGLGVPYGMLKLGLHFAHMKNSGEREFRIKDIPKDQQELIRKR